jgi:hypothetical protein
MKSYLALNSWAGRIKHKCTVLDETPKKYRVVFDEDVLLPKRRLVKAGQLVLVPKSAVRTEVAE